jgi:hypothetical protein
VIGLFGRKKSSTAKTEFIAKKQIKHTGTNGQREKEGSSVHLKPEEIHLALH